uniref:Tenascin n=2 Tax=Knipowitschia caucasica TaxID=637954 RepID=A0AAV2K655_KNICA
MSHFLLLLAVTSALCRHGVGQRSHAQNSIKVMISEGCVALGEAADADAGGNELSLSPGAPLVLTHHIRLVPSSPDSGPVSGSCDCVSDLDSLRERVERLERELSALRQKCGDPEANGGCTSRESKGAGCSVSPDPVSPVSLCPSDCSDQGRCVDGKCVCFSGFRGSDCSEETCSPPCGQRGRCMDGQCVCEPGFSGADCSMASCDCGGRGVCVDAQCVCDSGFTGESCAELACPRGCSQRGRCVDGVCVCDSGFSGADCGTGGCSSDCGQRGRCVQGKCVCQSGFTGDECERCGEGYGGKNCDMANHTVMEEDQTVMSSVEQLRTIDLTQSSVSVVWTQPRVQYESYGLVFTSQKDGSQVQAQVPGPLSSFRQTGLAPAQTYSITVTGATGDSRGAPSSTSFTTLPAPPSDLRVVKTSSSSAVIQWEPSPSAIDRYRLSVSPGDGTEGRGQDLTFDPGTSSAHITQLRAGLRYDITLVAESGQSHSAPLTTHATPGPEPPSDLRFSHVTDNSVTVSWTRPQSMVSGFKLTYTHTEEGEPVSVALDQGNSSIDLARLAPGSSYEVSVMSVLGLDESDEISKTLHTLPDPPTDLRAVNVSHAGALLLWRPSLTNVEKYTIVYGSGTGSEVRVSVSGNSAQKELSNLQPSTSYSVTISSERRGRESREDRTSFTTTSTSTLTTTESVSLGARNLRASHVTPRTAMLSWKPPSRPVIGYKLTYHTEGHKQEVSLGATVTQLNLTRLIPGEEYTAQLQTEGEEVLSTSFTTGSLRFPFPADCSEEQLNGLSVSGLVDIYPMGRKGAALSVWCDMDTDGGGWTVFQRRQDGSVDFFRSWREYVQGFGEPAGEFWLGLEALHNLTTRGSMMLRVDLRDRQDTVFAQYSTFEVSKRNYRLTVGGYSGTAGDSMSYHSGRIFTTKDRDPASFITRCAMSYRGGWWYKNCHEANLNGLYGTNSKHQGVIWMSWKGKETSIPFTEMKMRPTDYLPNTNNRA